MKFLMKKNNIHKIIILLVFLILFNFIVPMHKSNADVITTDVVETVSDIVGGKAGGILFSPIVDFTAKLGDATIRILQGLMTGNWQEIFTDKSVIKDTLKNGILPIKIATDIYQFATGDYINIEIPHISYTPEAIFKNKVLALDANFISPDATGQAGDEDTKSAVAILHNVIAGWYVGLRNLALVGLLSVLVYIGIKIVMSSVSEQKAKYKKMLMDWVVALCMLMVLHYFMAFVMYITDQITSMLDGNEQYTQQYPIGDDNVKLNLMESVRYNLQFAEASAETAFGYIIIYLVLVIFTIMFTIKYLKRVVYMAFLTLMAPMVALTYPLDKIKDSKAQAFDMWMKEYVYNALLQPFHLIIYRVLVGSAITLAMENPIYACVAIGFMIPAEKLLRKMFNFRDGNTGGELGSFAGGALVANMLQRVNKPLKGDKGGATSGGSKDNKIRYTANDTNFTGNLGSRLSSGKATTTDNKDNPAPTDTPKPEDINDPFAGKAQEKTGKDSKTEMAYEDYIYSNPYDNAYADYYGQSSDSTVNSNSSANQTDTPKAEEPSKQDSINIKPGNNIKPTGTPKKNKRSIWNGVKHVAGTYTRKATSGFSGKNVAKGFGRTVARAAGTAALGTIGIAAGVATGDYSNVLKYGAIGAAAGNAAGANAFNKMWNTGGNVADTFQAGYYGEDYADVNNEKQRKIFSKNFKKNQDNWDYLTKSYGVDAANYIMNNVAQDYIDVGITDVEKIGKAFELEQEYMNEGYTDHTGKTTILTQSQARDLVKDYAVLDQTIGGYSPRSVKDMRESLAEGFMDNNGIDESTAKEAAKGYINEASKLSNNKKTKRNYEWKIPEQKKKEKKSKNKEEQPDKQPRMVDPPNV